MAQIKILAIESSAKPASAAVCEDGKIIAQTYINNGLTHSRTLLPLIEDMLKNAGLSYDDIGLVAVAKGPGSFTGVRIGVSTAKGICWARDIPVIGVSTLEAMAWNLSDTEDIICAVMDARRNEVYNALFEMRGGALTRLSEDRAVPISLLEEEIKASGRKYTLVGDGAELCFGYLSEKGLKIGLAPENIRFQSAWGVAMASEGAESCPAGCLVPEYLRLSQAEREKLSKE